jgi:membrane protein DedA with SNARE-associated domain
MGNGIASFVLHLFTNLGYAGIVLAMAIESCCIPLPSELIMPLAGFLAFQQRFNLWSATVAGAVGCVVGSAVAYGIGATGGRPLLLRMNVGKFLAYTFLGSLPWCLVLAYAGYKLGEHWGEVSGVLHKYDILVGIGILALVALFLYRHLRRQKVEGRR